MTSTALDVPLRANVRHYSKHRLSDWVRPLTIAPLIVAVLAGAGWRIGYAATYQPLEIGSGGFGPVTSTAFKPVNDGFETTRWLLTAKPGSMGTFAYAVYNSGSDPVTIYDIPEPVDNWIYESMAWAPVDNMLGSRKLPVVVQPHENVELLLSVRKPPCEPNSGTTEINELVVNYRAFGFSHTIAVPLQGDLLQPIDVCWDRVVSGR